MSLDFECHLTCCLSTRLSVPIATLSVDAVHVIAIMWGGTVKLTGPNEGIASQKTPSNRAEI